MSRDTPMPSLIETLNFLHEAIDGYREYVELVRPDLFPQTIAMEQKYHASFMANLEAIGLREVSYTTAVTNKTLRDAVLDGIEEAGDEKLLASMVSNFDALIELRHGYRDLFLRETGGVPYRADNSFVKRFESNRGAFGQQL